ncbi:MAG: hypothetical protein ACTHK7_23715 [Aureliella sp.]
MKAHTKMCRIESRSLSQLMRWLLVVALLVGMPAQTSHCFAQDEAVGSSDNELTAAMPEAGTPPAPAATSKPEPTSQSTDVDTDQVRELSVSPELKPLLPADRPAWVGAPPDLSNSHRHRLFVGSLPSSSIEEAEATLDQPMVTAVRGYIDEQVLGGHGANELDITADFIRHNLLDRSTDYVAELSTSSGPMYQKWVVLEITPEQRQYFIEAHRQVQQRKRMVALGLGVAAVMGLMGSAHLAFNRRRRRYVQAVQPVVHAPLHHLEPEAPQRSGRLLWTLAGCLGGLMLLGVLFLGSVTIIHKSRTTHSLHRGPAEYSGPFPYKGQGQRVIIYNEPSPYPPAPPQPPTPPEVYSDALELRHAVEIQPAPPQ